MNNTSKCPKCEGKLSIPQHERMSNLPPRETCETCGYVVEQETGKEASLREISRYTDRLHG